MFTGTEEQLIAKQIIDFQAKRWLPYKSELLKQLQDGSMERLTNKKPEACCEYCML